MAYLAFHAKQSALRSVISEARSQNALRTTLVAAVSAREEFAEGVLRFSQAGARTTGLGHPTSSSELRAILCRLPALFGIE